MFKSALLLLLCGVCYSADAQYHLVFSDSSDQNDMNLVNDNIIKAKGIRKAMVYVYRGDNKEPELFQKYIYNADGTLANRYRYYKGRVALEDSATYDNQQRRIEYITYSGKKTKGINMSFAYKGDSVIDIEYDYSPSSGPAFKSYERKYFDAQKRLVKSSGYLDAKDHDSNGVTHYYYDSDGNVAQVKKIYDKDGSAEVFNYTYSLKKGRKKINITMEYGNLKNDNYEELLYNKKGQCISYSFVRIRVVHQFSYNDDGLVSTEDCIIGGIPTTYKYLYYTEL